VEVFCYLKSNEKSSYYRNLLVQREVNERSLKEKHRFEIKYNMLNLFCFLLLCFFFVLLYFFLAAYVIPNVSYASSCIVGVV